MTAPTRSAGGSSGGAAAGLACGMFAVADGSDTGGSLRNPASFNNVVGFRPSPGRVPNWPYQLGWTTLNVKGPMARTVADTALLLSAVAGPDPRAPISLETPGSFFDAPLGRDLRGLRVAWSPDLGGRVPVEADVAEVVRRAASVFADLGCEVEETCPDLAGADEVFLHAPCLDAENRLPGYDPARCGELIATLPPPRPPLSPSLEPVP